MMGVCTVGWCSACSKTHIYKNHKQCQWRGEYLGKEKPITGKYSLLKDLFFLIFCAINLSILFFIVICFFENINHPELTQMQVIFKVLGISE